MCLVRRYPTYAYGGKGVRVSIWPSNNTLQVTFDPLPIFASVESGIASHAPERGRWASVSSQQIPMTKGTHPATKLP